MRVCCVCAQHVYKGEEKVSFVVLFFFLREFYSDNVFSSSCCLKPLYMCIILYVYTLYILLCYCSCLFSLNSICHRFWRFCSVKNDSVSAYTMNLGYLNQIYYYASLSYTIFTHINTENICTKYTDTATAKASLCINISFIFGCLPFYVISCFLFSFLFFVFVAAAVVVIVVCSAWFWFFFFLFFC